MATSSTITVLPSPLTVPPVAPPPPPLPCDQLSITVPLSFPINNTANVSNKPDHPLQQQQIPAVERVRLRPLYWKKIQLLDVNSPQSRTVWKIVNDNSTFGTIDYKPLRKLFPASIKKSRSCVASNGSSSIVRLLEYRRSQAISILLRNLPDGVTELIDLDNCEIDPTILVSMAELIPPKKELQLISSYTEKHPGSTLDAPEQFVLQLSEIKYFKERAHLLLHESQFLERLASVQTNLSMLHDASNSLHHNEELCKVLGIILYIGNKLNAGNPRRGNSKGFELDILGKLRDVRTRDGTSNLLQYIVRCYASTTDKVMKNEFPLPCPIKLTAASQVSFEDLKTDMDFLQSQVKASEEIQKQISTLPHEKSAVFLRHAHANLKKVKSTLLNVESLFNDLLKFYCIDNKKGVVVYTPQKFFHLWIPFLQSFHHYWDSEQDVAAKLRLESMREDRLKSVQVRPLTSNGLKARLLKEKLVKQAD